MVEISASVLSVEPDNAARTFYNLEVGKINYYHIDVMDGKFVENNNLVLMKDYALTISHISNLGLDVHLMVEDIETLADDYLMLEPEMVTFHLEASKDEERTKNIIEDIKRAGSRVGIAISPETSIEEVKKYLPYVHMVLVMTVVPGKGGQELIPETLDKVKALREYMDANDIDIDIEVDGGINDVTSQQAIEAGANILVAGKYLIASEDIESAVSKLK